MAKEIPHPFIPNTTGIQWSDVVSEPIMKHLLRVSQESDSINSRGVGTPPKVEDARAIADAAYAAFRNFPDGDRSWNYAVVFTNTEDAYRCFLHERHILITIAEIDQYFAAMLKLMDGFDAAVMLRVKDANPDTKQDTYVLSGDEVELFIGDFIQRTYDLGYFKGTVHQP